MTNEIAQFEALEWAYNIAMNRDAKEVAHEISEVLLKMGYGEKIDFKELRDNLRRIRE